MTIKVTRLRTFSTPWKQKLKISTCFFWNSIKPGAGEYTGPAARNVGKSLIPNDGGDVNLHTCVIDQAWGQGGWILAKFFFVCLCIRQIQLRPAPFPGPLGNICLPCHFRGWGIIKFCVARGSGICPPRAFDTYYVDFDSHITKRGGFYWKHINKQIGSSIKDAKNVWEVFRGMTSQFMHAFLHCLSRQNLHCEIGSYL